MTLVCMALVIEIGHQNVFGAVILQRVDPQAVDHAAVWSRRASGCGDVTADIRLGE